VQERDRRQTDRPRYGKKRMNRRNRFVFIMFSICVNFFHLHAFLYLTPLV